MKIFAAGDIHGNSRLAEELAEKASQYNADLVILCGDLTMAESSTKNIIGPFLKRNLRVIFVPGNHETLATADFLAELYNVLNLHGKYYFLYDVGFFGCGGANIGLTVLPEDEIFETLKQGFYKVKKARKKIMVTHVHPAGTLMEKFTTIFPGSEGVRKAIEKFSPDIVLCSHVHEAEGLEEMIGKTKVINVGRKGKLIEV